MNTVEEIKCAYDKIRLISDSDEAGKISSIFSFEKELLSNNSMEVLEFQYNCLKDISDWRLYLCCRAGFSKRKKIAEEFILDKIKIEKDAHLVGDCIHILGKLRCEYALSLAFSYVHNDYDYIREVCLYVIGWIGDSSCLPLIKDKLTNENNLKIKIAAGSAMRQIFWRSPNCQYEVLCLLKDVYYSENAESIKGRLIELISTISGKNLGMKESKNDPEILIGDIDKAIIKTNKFLATI